MTARQYMEAGQIVREAECPFGHGVSKEFIGPTEDGWVFRCDRKTANRHNFLAEPDRGGPCMDEAAPEDGEEEGTGMTDKDTQAGEQWCELCGHDWHPGRGCAFQDGKASCSCHWDEPAKPGEQVTWSLAGNARLASQDAQDGEWCCHEHEDRGDGFYCKLCNQRLSWGWFTDNEIARFESVPSLTARVKELEDRLACKAPVIQYDPDCDHESDPIERVLDIVVNNMRNHPRAGKSWDCQDTCWLEDLEQARAIIQAEITARAEAAEAEVQRLRAALEAAAEKLKASKDRAQVPTRSADSVIRELNDFDRREVLPVVRGLAEWRERSVRKDSTSADGEALARAAMEEATDEVAHQEAADRVQEEEQDATDWWIVAQAAEAHAQRYEQALRRVQFLLKRPRMSSYDILIEKVINAALEGGHR